MKLFEILDDYDKALRKALLLVAEIFPYQFKKVVKGNYEADRPDGKLKIVVSLSGVNVRIDVFLNRMEFINTNELANSVNRLHKLLGGDTSIKLSNVSGAEHDNDRTSLNRRYTRIVPVHEIIKLRH